MNLIIEENNKNVKKKTMAYCTVCEIWGSFNSIVDKKFHTFFLYIDGFPKRFPMRTDVPLS